jgi:hypothetical protein
MKRGRPAFDPRVALYIWVLIEAYREPSQAGRPRASIRHASERLRGELHALCNVDLSMERLRAIYRMAADHLEADADLRRFAIWTLATTTAWRRILIGAGHAEVKRQIIPLLLTNTSETAQGISNPTA